MIFFVISLVGINRMDNIQKFNAACREGRIDIVNLMISKGVDLWNLGMLIACECGHIDIVNLMISKGADDWNQGMSCACRSGHIDIVNLMISKGANIWNQGMEYACRGGHVDIVNLMISKGADDWERGLVGARSRNHINIADLMILKLNKIPDYISELTEEQFYLFYKSGVIPSNRFKSRFDRFKMIDNKLKVFLRRFLLPDINNLILSY